MNLSKQARPNPLLPLLLACSITAPVFAFDNSDLKLSDSSWLANHTSSALSFGNSSQFRHSTSWVNNKWSGQSYHYQEDKLLTGLNNKQQWAMDVKRRLLSTKKDSFLAMGLGWNELEIDEGEISSGMRFVAEGRLGIYGPAYLFGEAAFSPWMTDAGENITPYAKELDLGLAVKPLPSLSFRAGYRANWLDTADLLTETTSTSQSTGFYLGGGLHW